MQGTTDHKNWIIHDPTRSSFVNKKGEMMSSLVSNLSGLVISSLLISLLSLKSRSKSTYQGDVGCAPKQRVRELRSHQCKQSYKWSTKPMQFHHCMVVDTNHHGKETVCNVKMSVWF
jgi:hypothetical protein